METFMIEICETLSRVILVEAETVGDAIEATDAKYRRSEIVLDETDCQDYTVKAL